ncbi:hypothetical protein BJ166DRAFT_521515 [Pestalotiopsis sp. NC0098]|nr:hypothetical protein BJ166DRAFT_521515 [Pestalotiopsis sp. NC0098]
MGPSPGVKKAGLQRRAAPSKPAIVGVAKRSTSTSSDSTIHSEPDQPQQPCHLLENLPLELRFMIYDILLLSPEAIPISRTRRLQLTRGQPTHGKPAHSRESTHEESTHGHTPSDSLEKCTPRWKPETAILRTCKQIDYEATRILYSKNEFHVSCPLYVFMPVTKFFLYDLRQSTLSYLRHLTFRAGCCCPRWVDVSQIEWKTTGEDLRKILFPHCSQRTLRPSPKRAQQVELLVKAHLWSRKSGYNACLKCSGRYTAWY